MCVYIERKSEHLVHLVQGKVSTNASVYIERITIIHWLE